MSDLNVVGSNEFVITKEYRQFVEFCEACIRYRYIGLCYGPPGVGKTLSAKHYSRWELIEIAHEQLRQEKPLEPEVLQCHTVFYTASVANNPSGIEREVRKLRNELNYTVDDAKHYLNGEKDKYWLYKDNDIDTTTQLIIVDEADRLKMAGLEQIRDIYDQSALGLVLVGMPGIEKRLSRYPQLYSRVGFVHQFRPLSNEELRFILEKKWQQMGLSFNPNDFTDAEAISAIVRISSGNFRLLQRLFTQIERILQINQLNIVTKEVVETARESLVIGLV